MLFISVVFVVAIFSSDFFPSLHWLGFEAEIRAYLLPVIPWVNIVFRESTDTPTILLVPSMSAGAQIT